MSKNSKVSTSIVLFNNNIEDLFKAIDSILRYSSVDKVFLIDNSPTDKLSSLMKINEDKVEYVFLNRNVGFGSAHNIAFDKSIKQGYDYHVIVNPDIYFNEDVITKLVVRMSKDETIGLIMPKIIYENGDIQHVCKMIPTPFNLILRRFFPFIKSKSDFNYEFKFFDYDKEADVPVLSGCFLMFRNSVLSEIKGFDERFFMYLEDVDISRRINLISRTLFYPKAEVVHKYEKGSYKNKKLLIYHMKSAVKYFNKWGWLFDKRRKEINNSIIKEYNL